MPDELKSAARRAACTSPHLCFEFGDNVACPPCEMLGAGILKERERCAKIASDFVMNTSDLSGAVVASTIAARIRGE